MAAENHHICTFCVEVDLLIIYPGLVHHSWLGSAANVVVAVGKSLDPKAHVRYRCQDFLFFYFIFFTLDVDRETRTAWPLFLFFSWQSLLAASSLEVSSHQD